MDKREKKIIFKAFSRISVENQNHGIGVFFSFYLLLGGGVVNQLPFLGVDLEQKDGSRPIIPDCLGAS